MIKAKKILFITQEMTPYVSESPLATLGRKVPQATQESISTSASSAAGSIRIKHLIGNTSLFRICGLNMG